MKVKQILTDLDLGASVAEFDKKLDSYFVDTYTFRAVISNRKDIVAGDKGTGKTALYRILMQRSKALPELQGTEVLSGFNPSGSPIFQQLMTLGVQTEGRYISFWKTYFLSFISNWLCAQSNLASLGSVKRLAFFIERSGLKTADNTAVGVFTKLVNYFSRFARPRSLEAEFAMTEAGMPSIKPRVEFDPSAASVQPQDFFGIDFMTGLKMLDLALNEANIDVWVALDRLDEAFPGYPLVEIPALRALLRTYLDCQALSRVRLKLFLRKDLFRKIIAGGFVNLTHINNQTISIVWEDDDLLNLLIRRVADTPAVVSELSLDGLTNAQAFAKIFPDKISKGENQATTLNWILSRIRDGNGIVAPRNLIDLLQKARESQMRAEEAIARDYGTDVPLIEADSVRRAQRALSEMRVEDTLLAESAHLVPVLEKFRDGKAEYNIGSLALLLGVEESAVRTTVKPLQDIGFLEEVGNSFKVPMIYRDGMKITQGKAFSASASDEPSIDE